MLNPDTAIDQLLEEMSCTLDAIKSTRIKLNETIGKTREDYQSWRKLVLEAIGEALDIHSEFSNRWNVPLLFDVVFEIEEMEQ